MYRGYADPKLTQVFYLLCLIYRQEKKVITMEMLGKIRRMHLRDKMSLHAIAKQTRLSRNTLRKWLRDRDEAAVPTYQRAPGTGKLRAFHAVLVLALKADAHRNKQNRRTAKALFVQIRADGYTGCGDVCALLV